MFNFNPSDVFFAAALCAILSFLVIRPVTSIPLAIFLTAVRFLVPCVYFLGTDFASSGWLLLDDITYLKHGVTLYDAGWESILLPFHSTGREYLSSLTGGSHYLYSWWVGLGMLVLGPFYFSPVFINILLSFMTSRIVGRLGQAIGLTPGNARAATALSLLHWDMIAWSSFVNLKDNLVLLFTTWLLLLIWQLYSTPPGQGSRLLRVAKIVFCCLIFLNLRFYVPLLMGMAFFLWVVLQGESKTKIPIAVAVLVGMKLLVNQVSPLLQDTVGGGEDIIFSIGKAILSPVPWNIVPEYSFLTIPAFFHLLTVPFAALGAISLYRRGSLGALLVTYYGLLLLLMAYQPEYFGPRHRFQGLSCLVFMQFEGFLRIFRPRKVDPLAPSNS